MGNADDAAGGRRNEVGGGLLAAAARVWRAEKPELTVGACEELVAAAKAELATAQDWNTRQWQAARDAAYQKQIAEAQRANDGLRPDRNKVERQIAEAQRLCRMCTDADTKADLEALVKWLQEQLDGELAWVLAPAKKPALRAFQLQRLGELGARLRGWEHMLKITRENWKTYQADQARIARVATALTAAAGSES